MVSLDLSPERVLDRQYTEASGDPGFAVIIAGHDLRTEDDLADLIELDGRKRVGLGRSVELRRYLDAIPNLTTRSVALDAAIDVTLRSMSQGRRPDSDAVRTLILNYPQLERPIRDAAVLGRSMLSTSDVHRGITANLPSSLPTDFGPSLPDGRARYELLELLGAGASGTVYRANDRQLSDADKPALVAVKLMRFRERSPSARQRFVEEATKARRITHPNVTRVLDRGIAGNDTDYIVYEFVDGGDLQLWLENRPGPMPPGEAAAMTAKIARAVHAAHVAGLVHCDLKPSNIVLTSEDEPKVTDFGIAVRADRSYGGTVAAPPDQPPGSLAFIAPEQYRMEAGSLATPADVYAVGGILYFLLTARYPNGQTLDEIQAAHDRTSGRTGAPSPRDVRPGIDRDLDAICRRALSPAPEDRHGSAADLAADLEAWSAHQPIYWTRPSLLRIVRLWAARRPFVLSMTLLLLLVIAASGSVAVRSWKVAAVKVAEANVANSYVEAGRNVVGGAIGMMKAMQTQHVDREMLPSVLFLESMIGDTVFGTAENRAKLWKERVRTASSLVTRAQQTGHGDDFETLTLQSAWAFWVVSEGRYAEARPIVDDNLSRWSARLRPEDPWLGQMRAVALCADVQRLVAEGAAEPSSDSPIHQIEAQLLDAERTFDGDLEGTPIHQLVLRTLIDLYGKGHLNSPKNRQSFEARLEQVTK